jgi:hypothetical protein
MIIKDLPIFELSLSDDVDMSLLTLSIVDKPAIMYDFLYFSEDKAIKYQFSDDEKMMIKGPALIPNQLISRTKPINSYVYFTKEVIKNFVEKLAEKDDHKFNVEHSDIFFNANLIESYFASEKNEFDVAEGSWIVSLKIKDKDIWEKIKLNKLNGFSIQSEFNFNLIKKTDENTKINEFKEEKMDIKEEVKKALASILFSETDEVKVDEAKVELAIDEPVTEPETVTETKISNEELLQTVKDELTNAIQSIKDYVDQKIAEVKGDVTNVDEKVEKFGNQPINYINEEKVDIVTVDETNKFSKYFGK